MKQDYIGINLKDMSPCELMDAATYCNSYINPYCEELCRRTGNLVAYIKDAKKASKAAARGFGAELH